MCLYLCTSTRVPLSWHIDTCLFHGTSTHVSLSWHEFQNSFAVQISFMLLQPLTNSNLHFLNSEQAASPGFVAVFGKSTAVLTSVLQVLVRPVPPSLWICELPTVFFQTSCTLMTSLPSTGGETYFVRTEAHHEILVGRSLQSHFRPIIKLSIEERLTDLCHLLLPNRT